LGLPALRDALLARYPWVGGTELGPQAVEAGECDVCGAEARLAAPCGPAPPVLRGCAGPGWAVGRRCLEALADDIWCGGHSEEGEQARAWAGALPAEADDVARLWWVATGEVRMDPLLLRRAADLALTVGQP